MWTRGLTFSGLKKLFFRLRGSQSGLIGVPLRPIYAIPLRHLFPLRLLGVHPSIADFFSSFASLSPKVIMPTPSSA